MTITAMTSLPEIRASGKKPGKLQRAVFTGKFKLQVQNGTGLFRPDLQPVRNLGADKHKSARSHLKGFLSAENRAASGSYVHDLKAAVGMERHMEFRQGKGVKRRDFSV